MIVIIPTNRSVNIASVQPLVDSGAQFIIVDDSEGSVQVDHPQFEVFNWQDQRRMMGDLVKAIPRRNGACRDFGFYLAWQRGGPDEIIIALDDDCVVYDNDFHLQVQNVLSPGRRPLANTAGAHLNILDAYSGVPANVFPRGFPYSARPDYKPCEFSHTLEVNPKFNLGLWKGIFDVNAIDKIKGPLWNHPDAQLRHPSVIVPPGKLASLCSMNMHFRKEVIPAIYQLPMHVETFPNWVIDRYGDIWGGFILEALMDIRGDALAVGGPMIRHEKEGKYERNIWQEHLCHLVNDEFIGLLFEAKEKITRGSYLEMMAELTEEFRSRSGQASSMLKPYLEHLAEAMAAWVKALR
jgi:hypothetical protein